jgi:integrase
LTGQRLREVSEMEWKEIDLDAKLWTLPAARAKNSIEHSIPLSDQTVEIPDCRQRFCVHDKWPESYPRHSPS